MTIEMVAEVTSKAALIAAIKGAAHPTYAEAKQNPVQIKFHTTTYTFKEGIHQLRAEEMATNIRKNKL